MGAALMRKFVVMGVSGCGKSAIGARFASAIGAKFIDGDDLHPTANVARMSAGMPLDDKDRSPWLAAIGQALKAADTDCVIACSALKRSYRDIIRNSAGGRVTFLHLQGNKKVIEARMSARNEHFMPIALLESQYATLERLGPDEDACVVDIDQAPDAIVAVFVAYSEENRSYD